MTLPVNQIICGAAEEVLKTLPDGSVNCCISSPPYWALRDYGIAGQLGLEPTFEEYIDKLCNIYDEVKRVLRPDGTCWVNLGDTYSQGDNPSNRTGLSTSRIKPKGNVNFNINVQQSIEQKSLCLIPQRFAIEMVRRGWILRNVIIWHKPNPMPSSAKDRFTVDFEQVYFFVKNNNVLWHYRPADGKVSDRQPDYKNGIEGLDWQWGTRKGKPVKLSSWQGFKYFFEPQYEAMNYPERKYNPNTSNHKTSKLDNRITGGLHDGREQYGNPALGRNKRTVWTIPTEAFSEAHFATFPRALVEPMILAGCPEFVCKKCGKARVKIVETSGGMIGKDMNIRKRGIINGDDLTKSPSIDKKASDGTYKKEFKGYTDCGCNAGWRPGVCLDMFRRLGHGRFSSRPVAA